MTGWWLNPCVLGRRHAVGEAEVTGVQEADSADRRCYDTSGCLSYSGLFGTAHPENRTSARLGCCISGSRILLLVSVWAVQIAHPI